MVKSIRDPETVADLADPAAWRQALAVPLAEAVALGRLDATLAGLTPEAAAGAVTRLALAETECHVWAGGIVRPQKRSMREAATQAFASYRLNC